MIETVSAKGDYGLPATPDWRKRERPIRERQVEIAGRRLNFAESGQGQRAFVLIHGMGGRWQHWLETIPTLARHGRVLAIDLPGFGRSELPVDGVSLDGYADTAAVLCRALSVDRAVILGHSMGGLIALLAAPRLANRIERMTVTSPFIGLHGRQAGTSIVRLVSSLATAVGLGGLSTNGNRPINQTFEGNGLTHDPARFARNKAIYDSVPRLRLAGPTFRWVRESFKAIKTVNDPDHLASIRIPTLILAAGADNIVPIAEVEELASHFRAAELITIDHARHEMFQESDIYREQVMAAVRTFLPGGES